MTETTPAYTDRLFTKPQEHTLYPLPQRRYECSECGAAGYHYPATGEVLSYHACIRSCRVTPGSQHVWVYEGTVATQGTGIRVFEVSDDDIRALRDEALAAGDFEQAALCEAALSGAHVHPGEAGRAYAAARQKCEQVILDARMRAAEDEEITEERLDEQATLVAW